MSTCKQRGNISSTYFSMVGKYLTLTATRWTKPIDSESRQTGKAANASLLAFVQDGPNNECHQLWN